MKINLNFSKKLASKISLAVATFVILAMGFTPTLAGATSQTVTETTGGTQAPTSTTPTTTTTSTTSTTRQPYNYCAKDSDNKPKPVQKDTTGMTAKQKKATEDAYAKELAAWRARIPACLVLYGAQRYKAVVVIPASANTNEPNTYKTAVCAGQPFVTKKGDLKPIQIKLIKNASDPAAPSVISCSAGNYNVYYLRTPKKGKSPQLSTAYFKQINKYASVGLQQHHCSYVSPTKINKVNQFQVIAVQSISADGFCPVDQTAAAFNEAATKSDSVLTAEFNPNPVIRGKAATYTVILKSADSTEKLDYADCAGTFKESTVVTSNDGKTKRTIVRNIPMRLKTTDGKTVPAGVCNYQLRLSANQTKAGSYLAKGIQSMDKTITFSGNNTMTPATVDLSVKIN